VGKDALRLNYLPSPGLSRRGDPSLAIPGAPVGLWSCCPSATPWAGGGVRFSEAAAKVLGLLAPADSCGCVSQGVQGRAVTVLPVRGSQEALMPKYTPPSQDAPLEGSRPPHLQGAFRRGPAGPALPNGTQDPPGLRTANRG